MPRKNHRPSTSRTPIPIQGCGSKRRFPTERQAEAQAELQMLEQPSLALGVYRCTACGKWHLTSRPNGRSS